LIVSGGVISLVMRFGSREESSGGLPTSPLSVLPTTPRTTLPGTPPSERIDPAIAQRANIHGEVILECIMDGNGDVKVNKVLEPVAMAQSAAEDAVTRWKYKPAMPDGHPQAVYLVVRVKFSLLGVRGKAGRP
jgi:TonB family protein